MNFLEFLAFLSITESDFNILWLIIIEVVGFFVVYFNAFNKFLYFIKLVYFVTKYLFLSICFGPIGCFCYEILLEYLKKISRWSKKIGSNVYIILYYLREVNNLRNIDVVKEKKTYQRKVFKYEGTFNSNYDAIAHLKNNLGCEYKYRYYALFEFVLIKCLIYF